MIEGLESETVDQIDLGGIDMLQGGDIGIDANPKQVRGWVLIPAYHIPSS